MSNLSPLDGLLALWERVVDSAEEELRGNFPNAAADFDTVARSIDLEEQGGTERLMADGREVFTRAHAALGKPARNAVEHGVAMFKSLDRLRACVARYVSLVDTDAATRDLEEMEALLDLWAIYMQRFIEVTVKFAESAATAAAIDSPTTMSKLQGWSKTPAAIARLRQEAAHGNPNSVSGVNDEGLWEPMILVGAARTRNALEAMLALDRDALNARLEVFSPEMKRLTAEHIAAANSLCRELAQG